MYSVNYKGPPPASPRISSHEIFVSVTIVIVDENPFGCLYTFRKSFLSMMFAMTGNSVNSKVDKARL